MLGFLSPYATAIKWGAIAITILAILSIGSFAVNSWYDTVQENAVLEMKNSQLRQDIKDKDEFIRLTELVTRLKDEIIVERDKTLDELERQVDALTEGLPENPNDTVPESTKELIKRLKSR